MATVSWQPFNRRPLVRRKFGQAFSSATGGAYSSRTPATDSFFAPLNGTIVLARGVGAPSFVRATVGAQFDHEALYHSALSGEARFDGFRRVHNGVATTSENFSNAAWAKINGGTGSAPTVTAGQTDPLGGTSAYRLQCDRGAGTALADYSMLRNSTALTITSGVGSIWVKSNTASSQVVYSTEGNGTATFTVTTSWQRMSGAVNGTDWDFGTRRGVSDQVIDVLIYRAQLESVTGQSNQNPSEYVSVGVLSTPFHGAGVDGIKYFSTLNGNTVV